MSFEVVVEELRASALKFRAVQDAMACYAFPQQDVSAASVGHVELADWMIAVLEQCDKAGDALHLGADVLADGLDDQARDYETADAAARSRFGGPW